MGSAQDGAQDGAQHGTRAGGRDRYGPMAGGLLAVVMWGLAPVATRAAVAHLAPVPLLVLRLGLAAVVLLPWAVPVFGRLRPGQAGRLVAAGLLGLVGYNLPVTVGLQWLPAATAGLLLATEPVWVMVLSYLFLAERAGGRAWLGSAVALGGVLVLAGPGALAGAGGYRALAGAGLVLGGTLAFGAYTIVLRPLSQAFGAVRATAASTVVGALPYLAFAGTLPRLAQAGPGAVGRARVPRPGQHAGRDDAVEPGRALGRQHPGQPAPLPGAGGQRARRGALPGRAGDPGHAGRRPADPGRRSRGQHGLPNLQHKGSHPQA